MDPSDLHDRVHRIAQSFLEERGTGALGEAFPPAILTLDIDLHNRIMTECPDLPPSYRFRITSWYRKPGSIYWDITIDIELVTTLGSVNIIAPATD